MGHESKIERLEKKYSIYKNGLVYRKVGIKKLGIIYLSLIVSLSPK
jgi:hypothetical protein